MDLSTYVDSVRDGVNNAAALADEHSRQIADKLGSAVESSTRLALLLALSDAAAEITIDLAPGSVEVRMSGSEPTFVVNAPHTDDAEPTILMPHSDTSEADIDTAESLRLDEDEAQARVSLRLPQSVKEKVDEYADSEGVSTNTWLLHRVLEALAERSGASRPRSIQQAVYDFGEQMKRMPFGGGAMPMPPMPPNPPGFPSVPFGPDPADQARGRNRDRTRRDRDDRGRGSVRGWVQ